MSKLDLATRAAVRLNDHDEAILRGFIEVFPSLRYDYDRVHGKIPVPFDPGEVYVRIENDHSAPDRFRIQCAERHHLEVDAFIRESAGFLPTYVRDRVEGQDLGCNVASTADPFARGVPGGLISDITEFILETSPSPVREFATMAAVAFLAAYFGRRVVTPTGLGLNIYAALIAPTGWGKERPLRALSELAAAVGKDRIVGPNDFASDSALEHMLRYQPCQVLPLDELGLFFRATDRHAEAYAQAKIKALLEVFSKSTGPWAAKVRAADFGKKRKPLPPIHWPTLSVLGVATPETLYEGGLNERAFGNGLVPRWIFVSAEQEPPVIDIRGVPAVPADLSDRLKQALAALPKGGDLADVSAADPNRVPLFHEVPWADDDAAAGLLEIRKWGKAARPGREVEGMVISRVGEITSKLATIRALSTSPAAPAVAVEDLRWALGVARISHATIVRDAEQHMAGSDFEALWKAVRAAIGKAGEDGIPHSELLRRCAAAKRAKPYELSAALEHLEHSDQIQDVGNKSGRGRRGARYLLRQ